MNLAALITRYRILANDKAEPPFVTDEDVTAFLNEAVQQACIRARLIHESANPSVCAIDVTEGVSVHPLNSSLYEIDHLSFTPGGETRAYPVRLASPEWMDDNVPDWRTREGDPRYALQNDESLRLVPRPTRPGMMTLEGYRLPLAPLALPDDVPEIHTGHHPHLVDWALSRAFSIPDSEFFDPKRAAEAEAQFESYFGPAPDADMGRLTREDFPHVVAAFMP